MSKKPEVLSPCGSPECVEAALRTGADAVYLGLKSFSARHNAQNFSDDEFKAAVSECHRSGVLVYLTLNTVLFEDELRPAASALRLACEAGADGVIIQDMAVFEMIKAACPDMPAHASTQMNIHTASGARLAGDLGFSRVVASRECSLSVLKKMADTGVEIEAFVHGALCMCVSGECYLSAAIGGRSANRGLCAGACRLPFSAAGKPRDDYALSLKDLSYTDHVDELREAGVCSLKIEGRMKRPEYVAAATDAIRKAVDREPYDKTLLRAVFSRSGFTDSYINSSPGAEMFGRRGYDDVLMAADVLPKLKKLYEKPRKRFTADLALTAKSGEPMRLEAACGGVSITVSGPVPEPALTRPSEPWEAVEQLRKCGGTQYEAGKVSAEISPGLMIPKSHLNALRREALSELDLRREKSFPPKSFDGGRLTFDFPMPLILKHPALRVRVEKTAQLSLLQGEISAFVIPLSEAESYINSGYDPEKAVLSLPRFTVSEEEMTKRLKSAKNLGFKVIECSSAGDIALAKKLGIEPVGGFGLNVTNSLAARHYFFAEGLKTLLLSPELEPRAAGRIAVPAKTGAIVYGRLPLMITRNCPIRAQVGCKGCKNRLVDRTGAEFPLICRREMGVYELLNSRPIWLSDRWEGFNLDFADMMFTVESPEECAEILKKYRTRDASAPAAFTRGIKISGDKNGAEN